MKTPVKTFEANTQGRDFVIGDLHGSLSCLEMMLAGLQFDKTRDRLFSVGDLTDRGPSSLECLCLLQEPWFHSVISNHEQMLLDSVHSHQWEMIWKMNGGGWCSPRGIPTLISLVQELPWMITVKRTDGSPVHIVHAELPPGSGATDELLQDPEFIDRISHVETSDGPSLIWGRFIFRHFYAANLADHVKVARTFKYFCGDGSKYFNSSLGHIISGHTPVQHPLTLLGQTNIDTMAFRCYDPMPDAWAGLTCVDINSWKFYKATPRSFAQVQPVVVNKSDI